MAAERISRAQFRKEVLDALRAAGLEGPFEHDETGDRLLHTSTGSFDLREAYDNIAALPAPQRAGLIASAIASFVDPPRVPARWEEARTLVLPAVRPRIALMADDVRRARGSTSGSSVSIDVTEHVVIGLVLRQSATSRMIVSADHLATWGVPPQEAFPAALENLRRLPDVGWGLMNDAPGAYFSQWRDGFDAARLAFPQVFARVPLRGRPVALALSASALAFAGADDAEGLFHLARMARRLYEQSRSYLFLRTIRLGEDGESWEDWMPPGAHPAHAGLRLLRAVNEAGDYEEQAHIVRRAAEGKGTALPMPRLEIQQSPIGAEVMTTTRWSAAAPCALPRADAIVFERAGETLGIVPWEVVTARLPDALRPMPGYPARFLASEFPEAWQLATLDLKPWGPA
jgi:hypothetical protein